MSISENKELVRRYFEAISGKPKPAAVINLYVSDKALAEHIEAAEAGFPLYELIADEIIAEGDLVAIQARLRGEHLGSFMGMAPTGRTVDMALFLTYRIAGGKIVDHWMVSDNLTMLQQLGQIPAMAE
jgi:predicted ester cyclase